MQKIILALSFIFLFIPIKMSFANDYSNDYPNNQIYKSLEKENKVLELRKKLPNETLKNLENIGIDGTSLENISKIQPTNILSLITSQIKNTFKKIIKPILLTITIILLCSIFKNFSSEFNKKFSNDIINLICVLTLSIFIVNPIINTINCISNVLRLSCKLLLCYIPIISGLMLSNGKVLSSYVHSNFLVGFANLVLQISSVFFIPILNLLLAFAVVASITSYTNLYCLYINFLKITKIVLGLLVTIFIGFFSMKVTVNLAMEDAGTRSLKFLLGSCVPIVGKALGEATSTIKSCINVLKSGTSLFFTISMFITFLPQIVECILWYLTANICSSIGEIFDIKCTQKLLKSIAEIMSVLIVMILCFLVIIIASTIVVVKTAES